MGTQKGFTVWFTGLSGSGKSSITAELVAELRDRRGLKLEVLDGDVVRTHLSKGLGFSREDRDTNILRIGWVCELLTRNDVIAIAAAISPYREIRNEVREMVGHGKFVEVYTAAPLEVCESRDVKGLYAKARKGEIPMFTGVSDPYEPPDNPEVTCNTGSETVKESTTRIIRKLQEMKLID